MRLLAEQLPSGAPALIVGHLASVTMVHLSHWKSMGSLWASRTRCWGLLMPLRNEMAQDAS
ncbi:uncharacterized protein VDAG_02055 [Verticillium dahliae VdLs.17]|uniref:Uncharacterized protein n=1 Tax=Verticillium dahliae (strain VdLs.17 / ATCC MYA-4575 / FGSC 10137) TaxID=498257 RepID=G2WUR4_VERDV|nr:uncharacterized protein VDAG_02055 [Verticillium dahliae VdLs.17]EGY20039.1 hypothetical protein VDAG_02055 [Verticillium dahliae VdLs.17]